ncbi:MAG: hypothetical protein A2428_03070 [Bdellovibrionales bacterium RIFOXYC1_FULL_54_43]|nr:MAG: hypothetical protein A2428_03070 [Bdellovibrionales bacterium RIFOXYC1_FULL_54_43]OFZ82663.1 MAG: hypothetical protein A2603_02505 [Bdellovibrionales bacterium RIFOXYD1_FULL_55_31]
MGKRKRNDEISAPKSKLFPIDKLVPYEKNPRIHPEHQVQQLVDSITEYGFVSPLVIDSKFRVIAGHGRLMAANRLGLSHVPCVIVDHLTEAQRRAYIIADNRLALNSDWDMDILKEEVRDLDADGFDIDVLGFSLSEIEALTVDLKSVPRVRKEKKSNAVDCPSCGHRFTIE